MNEASSCSPVGAFVFWRCIVLLRHVCAVVYSGGLDTGGCSNASHFPSSFLWISSPRFVRNQRTSCSRAVWISRKGG